MSLIYDRLELSAATLQDHTTGQDIPLPEWEIGGTPFVSWWEAGERWPSLYPKGEQLVLKASFKVRDSFGATTDTIRVFAGVGGPDAPKVGILNSAANPVALTYNAEKKLWEGLFTSKNAPDKIGVLKVHWNWQANNATKDPTKWKDAGTSHHHIFISNKQPLGKPYVWVAWWACEWAAGKNTDQDVLDAMLDKLKADATGTTGPKVDLNYSKREQVTGNLLAGPASRTLLWTKHARCGQWASFFDDLAAVHGIPIRICSAQLMPGDKDTVEHLPVKVLSTGIVVLDWTESPRTSADLWWYYKEFRPPVDPTAFPLPIEFNAQSEFPNYFFLAMTLPDVDGDITTADHGGTYVFYEHTFCLFGDGDGAIVYDPSFPSKTLPTESPRKARWAHIKKLFGQYAGMTKIKVKTKYWPPPDLNGPAVLWYELPISSCLGAVPVARDDVPPARIRVDFLVDDSLREIPEHGIVTRDEPAETAEGW